MPKEKRTCHRHQSGMGLVEIMVAVLIAMIGMMAMFQIFALSESRKRSISGSSDMDVSGRLGLLAIQRDVELAGYGFGQGASATATPGGAAFGCTVNAYDSQRATGTQDFTFTFAPLQITQGASGAPDSIMVLEGSSSYIAASQTISQSTASTTLISSGTGNRAGMFNGDMAITVAATPSPACAMYEITDTSNPDQLTLGHILGSYTNALGQTQTARYNKSGGVTFTMTGNGAIYDLGSSPRLNVWSIQNNQLVESNNLAFQDLDGDGVNDVIQLADNIVNLQAQYGVDRDGDGKISDSEWTETTPTDWTKVRAVRLALLARSTHYEPNPVTTVAPQWSGGTCSGTPPCGQSSASPFISGPFTMTNIDGTADSNPTGPNNWRNYRYSVYEVIIPLKNVIWGALL